MPNSRLFDADSAQLQLVASKFHAIAQPVRLRIAMLLVQKELSVMQLTRRISTCSQSNVSQHLAVMRNSGLLDKHRVKREVLYWRSPAGDSLLAAAASAD